MSTYAGQLDGLSGTVVRGWVKSSAGGPVSVSFFVDGEPVGRALADELRADLVIQGVGDGRHGFSFDLRLVPGLAEAAVIQVAVEDGEGCHAIGTVALKGVVAAGRIERLVDGHLVGWAHGLGYEPVRLGIYRDGKLTIGWPCNIVDDTMSGHGIGPSRHRFRIPIAALFPGSRLSALTFRLLPGGLELTAGSEPPETATDSVSWRLPALDREPVVVGNLKLAILESLARKPQPSSIDAGVLIAPSFLDELLNRLAAAEASATAVACYADLVRAERPITDPSAQAARQQLGRLGEIGHRLAEIALRSSETAGDALIADLERDIVPLYRERTDERANLDAAIDGLQEPRLLRAIMRAFRKHDFVDVPIRAFRRSLAHAPQVELADVHFLSQISGWSKGDELTAPRHLRRGIVVKPSRRRALYVLWRSVPYDLNGYATRSHYLLRSLRHVGEDVVAATRLGYPWDAEHRKGVQAQVEVVDDVLYVHHGSEDANRRTLPLEVYVSECAERLAMTAVSVGADVIHSASNWLAALPALRAARRLGLPFCYEVRGLWEITRASNVPGYAKTDQFQLFHRMEGYVARQADQVFAITRQVVDEMARRGCDPSQMLITPNGVEIGRFRPEPSNAELAARLGITTELVFGYLGTFAKYEGLLELCAAAVELRKTRSDFKMLLLGDGPMLGEVRAYCREHDRAGCIIIHDRVPFHEVPSFYSLIDVAVFPRLPTEITEMVSPLKPFEAMAMAKPVIGSSVQAIAEIIQHDRTGWLFDKGSSAALTQALQHAIERRSQLPQMGRAARAFVEEHHDWQVVARTISEGWRRVRATRRAEVKRHGTLSETGMPTVRPGVEHLS